MLSPCCDIFAGYLFIFSQLCDTFPKCFGMLSQPCDTSAGYFFMLSQPRDTFPKCFGMLSQPCDTFAEYLFILSQPRDCLSSDHFFFLTPHSAIDICRKNANNH